jgi:hypothetical protein
MPPGMGSAQSHPATGAGVKQIEAEPGEVDVLAMRRAIQANLENETYAGHPLYWARQ